METDQVPGIEHAQILDVEIVLHREPDRLAGLLVELLHQVEDRSARHHVLGDPRPDRRELQRRQIGAALAVVVEVAQHDQALEQHRGARLRIAEPLRDLLQRKRLAALVEELEDLEDAGGGFDGRTVHGGTGQETTQENDIGARTPEVYTSRNACLGERDFAACSGFAVTPQYNSRNQASIKGGYLRTSRLD